MYHLSEMQICFRQSATVESAGRSESELSEIGFPLLQIEVGAYEREGFGECFCIIKELVHALWLGDGESLRGCLSLPVQSLQLPLAVKEIEIGLRLRAASDAA